MRRFVDLTHPINTGMPVYPGDEPVHLQQTRTVAADGYANMQLTMGMHAGTHIDAPRHMLETGPHVAELDLSALCGRAWICYHYGEPVISLDKYERYVIRPGDKVLFYTGWDRYYGQPEYYQGHPVLSKAAVKALIARRVTLVGIDAPSPDYPPFPVHKAFFAAGIVLLENLTNLGCLAGPEPVKLTVLPLKIAADGAPARVVAQLPE